MTEAEWLACEELAVMLDYLYTKRKLIRGAARSRKYRLFGCSCVRRLWGDLAEADRQAVEWAERYADGVATRAEMPEAWQNLHPAVRFAVHLDPGMVSHDVANVAYFRAGRQREAALQAYRAERKQHPALLREIMGNPFGPAVAVSAWLTPAVKRLAQAGYEERESASGHLDIERLAVLSDALEDAGCDDAAILEHLRSPGPHGRGCWALDLVLGKL